MPPDKGTPSRQLGGHLSHVRSYSTQWAMSGHLCIIRATAVFELPPAALRVYAALGTYTDRRGFCRVKQETLSTMLGISRQAVQKQVSLLRKAGWIEEKRTGRSSEYRVLLDVPNELAMERPMQPGVASDATSEVASEATTGGIDRTIGFNDVLQRREGAARKRNPTWDALAEVFGEPATPSERSLRGKTVRELASFDPEEVKKRAKAMMALWGRNGRTPTETALVQRWTVIGEAMQKRNGRQTDHEAFWKELA